jgi:hypothetical protein
MTFFEMKARRTSAGYFWFTLSLKRVSQEYFPQWDLAAAKAACAP